MNIVSPRENQAKLRDYGVKASDLEPFQDANKLSKQISDKYDRLYRQSGYPFITIPIAKLMATFN